MESGDQWIAENDATLIEHCSFRDPWSRLYEESVAYDYY